jgi:hypothetical protein
VLADPHLQEYTQGREQYRDNDTEHVHRNLPSVNLPSVCLTSLPTTLPEPGGCKHQGAGGEASSQAFLGNRDHHRLCVPRTRYG